MPDIEARYLACKSQVPACCASSVATKVLILDVLSLKKE